MNAIVQSPAHQLKPAGGFDLSPQNFEQALTFSNYLAESDMVPKDFKGKPGNCLIAMQWGAELGLKPLQSLQNLAVINGRPALWGDAVIALVLSSPVCEYVNEEDDGETATCRVKRKGGQEQVRTFSMEDAKRAGLAGKQGPWSQYPKRMRQMRARAFALRDVFPDVLRGMAVAEELQDMATAGQAPVTKDMGAAEVVVTPYTDDEFTAKLPQWRAPIESGKKSADDLMTFVLSKATNRAFTDGQKATLRAVKPKQPESTDTAGATKAAAGAPHVSTDQLAERLRCAADHDSLYEAANLMEAVTDEVQRQQLNEIFEARQAELNGAQA